MVPPDGVALVPVHNWYGGSARLCLRVSSVSGGAATKPAVPLAPASDWLVHAAAADTASVTTPSLRSCVIALCAAMIVVGASAKVVAAPSKLPMRTTRLSLTVVV